MLLAVQIALCVFLGIVLWQDLKDRAVHWVLFLGVCSAASYLFYVSNLPIQVLVVNFIFLALLMAGLGAYLFLKEGRLFNFFKTHFGIGDLVFFIAIAPLFEPQKFVLFFISGMVLSGLFHFIISRKKENSTIPLAGYLSGYLILLIGLKLLGITEPFYTSIL